MISSRKEAHNFNLYLLCSPILLGLFLPIVVDVYIASFVKDSNIFNAITYQISQYINHFAVYALKIFLAMSPFIGLVTLVLTFKTTYTKKELVFVLTISSLPTTIFLFIYLTNVYQSIGGNAAIGLFAVTIYSFAPMLLGFFTGLFLIKLLNNKK